MRLLRTTAVLGCSLAMGVSSLTSASAGVVESPAAQAQAQARKATGAKFGDGVRVRRAAVVRTTAGHPRVRSVVRVDALRDSGGERRRGRADRLSVQVVVLPRGADDHERGRWLVGKKRTTTVRKDGSVTIVSPLTRRQRRELGTITVGTGGDRSQRHVLVIAEHTKTAARRGRAEGRAGRRPIQIHSVDSRVAGPRPKPERRVRAAIEQHRGTDADLFMRNSTDHDISLIAAPVQCMYSADSDGGWDSGIAGGGTRGLTLLNGYRLGPDDVIQTEVASESDWFKADADEGIQEPFLKYSAEQFDAMVDDEAERGRISLGTGLDVGYFTADATVAVGEFIGLEMGVLGEAMPVAAWAIALGTGIFEISSDNCDTAPSKAVFGARGIVPGTNQVQTSMALYRWSDRSLNVEDPHKAVVDGLEQGLWTGPGMTYADEGGWGNWGKVDGDGGGAPERFLDFYDSNFPRQARQLELVSDPWQSEELWESDNPALTCQAHPAGVEPRAESIAYYAGEVNSDELPNLSETSAPAFWEQFQTVGFPMRDTGAYGYCAMRVSYDVSSRPVSDFRQPVPPAGKWESTWTSERRDLAPSAALGDVRNPDPGAYTPSVTYPRTSGYGGIPSRVEVRPWCPVFGNGILYPWVDARSCS